MVITTITIISDVIIPELLLRKKYTFIDYKLFGLMFRGDYVI
jgi:hypothetical protein